MFDETPDHLTRVQASTLRFGDRLPYFGANVRSVDTRGVMLRVHFVKRLGMDRTGVTLYPSDMVYTVRAGSAR